VDKLSVATSRQVDVAHEQVPWILLAWIAFPLRSPLVVR
jgi:hypothetical protein